MYSTGTSPINRSQSIAPVCKLFAKTFLSQGNQKMYRRKAGSVSSCDSLATTSSNSMQGQIPYNQAGFAKTKSNQKSGKIDKELDVLARELLPRVLKIPFTVEQWMSAIYSACGECGIDGSGDDYSEEDCNQRKRFPCPERPKLPTIGLASMEKRLRNPQAKLCPKEAPSPVPQQTITVRVPDPMNLPIMWVPKLPPQTAQLLNSMPCEIFQDIHKNCKQESGKPPAKKCPPRRKSPQRKPLSRPAPKPTLKPRQRSRRRRRPCCCCCRMTRQEFECAGMASGPAPAYRSPSKPASAPSPSKQFKSKPAPKPKPKPKAKPAPKKAAKSDKADEDEPPKVEVKVEEPKPAPAPAAKAGSESSSDDSSDSDTPPVTPAAPAPPASPAAGKDFMSDLFASSPAPSGASSPKPAAADWMSDFGGASSPKPPASGGADWMSNFTGGTSSPKPPASSGADWLS